MQATAKGNHLILRHVPVIRAAKQLSLAWNLVRDGQMQHYYSTTPGSPWDKTLLEWRCYLQGYEWDGKTEYVNRPWSVGSDDVGVAVPSSQGRAAYAPPIDAGNYIECWNKSPLMGSYGNTHVMYSGDEIYVCASVYVDEATDEDAFIQIEIDWYDENDNVVLLQVLCNEHGWDETPSFDTPLPTSGFETYSYPVTVPEDLTATHYWKVCVTVYEKTSGGADAAKLYVTNVGVLTAQSVYRDGSHNSWRWLEESWENWAYRVGREAPGWLSSISGVTDWNVNLVPNPCASVDNAGWLDDTYNDPPERVTTTSFGMPEGRSTAFHWEDGAMGESVAQDLPVAHQGTASYGSAPPEVPTDFWLPVSFTWAMSTTGTGATYGELYCEVQTKEATSGDYYAGVPIVRHLEGAGGQTYLTGALEEWHEVRDVLPFIDQAEKVSVIFYGWTNGSGGTEHLYVTDIRIGGLSYADGDSAGWEWDGTAHNSISRKS